MDTKILLENGTNELEVLEFTLGDFSYGINVAKIKEIIPSIEWNRDKLFCHFVEKQSEHEINDIVVHFPQVFDILAGLHNKAMNIFNVDNSEIRVMPEEMFVKLKEEKTEFSHLLMGALLDNDIRKVLKRRE